MGLNMSSYSIIQNSCVISKVKGSQSPNGHASPRGLKRYFCKFEEDIFALLDKCNDSSNVQPECIKFESFKLKCHLNSFDRFSY